MNPKHRGPLCEIIATAWLLKQGYEVFRNVSMYGIMDLIAVRGDEIIKIDVKSKKKCPARGRPSRVSGGHLNHVQYDAGVVILAVDGDNECSFLPRPSRRPSTKPIHEYLAPEIAAKRQRMHRENVKKWPHLTNSISP